MSVDPFIDTNIWVYAHTEEPRDLRGPRARTLVEDGRRFVISTQVLSEYYAAMLKNGATDCASSIHCCHRTCPGSLTLARPGCRTDSR